MRPRPSTQIHDCCGSSSSTWTTPPSVTSLGLVMSSIGITLLETFLTTTTATATTPHCTMP